LSPDFDPNQFLTSKELNSYTDAKETDHLYIPPYSEKAVGVL